MPDVLFASLQDWANIAFVYAQSLRSIGVDAFAFVQHPHGFDYPVQAKQVPQSEWVDLFKQSKIVVNMHSVNIVNPISLGSKGVSVDNLPHFCVFHGGASYRRNPAPLNNIFNSYVDCTLIQTGDLLGLGAKNPVWLLPAIDLETIKPKFGIHGKKIKIASYPRSYEDKGGAAINRVIERIRKDKRFNKRFTFESTKPGDKNVPWKDSIARMGECDIYIECLAPTHLDKPHGAWGVTALECAALGKIVVTNFAHAKLYEREYGECALRVGNTEAELEEQIRILLDMDQAALENLQIDTREWAEKQHSFGAVGKRLKAALDWFCYGKKDDIKIGNEDTSPHHFDIPLPLNISNPTIYDPRSFWEVQGMRHKCVGETTRQEGIIILNALVLRELLDCSILEVGQGQGATYSIMTGTGAKLPNYKMVDFIQSSRYKCKELTGIMPDGWDGKVLPYEDESFDMTISTDVMLHVPPQDIAAFVREHVRVSKTWMVVSSYIGHALNKDGAKESRPLPDLSFHSFLHDYEALWEENGMVVVEKRVTGDGLRCVWVLKKKSVIEADERDNPRRVLTQQEREDQAAERQVSLEVRG